MVLKAVGSMDCLHWLFGLQLTPMPFSMSVGAATSTQTVELPVVSPPAPISHGSIGICEAQR